MESARRDRCWAVGLAAVLAALYLRGHAQTFGPGDSPMHALSALTWGVPRAPGYPLQTVLGFLASRLPFGSPAGNVNALSGLFQAAAGGLFFLLLRGAGLGRPASAAAVGLWGLAPLVWFYSQVAEVRALNHLLALAAAAALTAWARERRPAALAAAGAALGLGLGHHPSFALLLPGFAVFLALSAPPRRDLVRALALAAACLAGPYLLLSLRLAWSEPAFNLDGVGAWEAPWRLWSRRDLGGWGRLMAGSGVFEGAFDAQALALHGRWLLEAWWGQLGPVGLGAAAVGAGLLARRRERSLWVWAPWVLLPAVVVVLVGSQQFRIVDPPYLRGMLLRQHLLPLAALAALAAYGFEAVLSRVRPAYAWALALACWAAPALLHPVGRPGADPLYVYARGLAESSGPRDILVPAGDDAVGALWYLQSVEGRLGDRVVVPPALLQSPVHTRALERRHPDLRLPYAPDGSLKGDWAAWAALNPGRAVLVDPILRPALMRGYRGLAPQGLWVRVGGAGLSKEALGRELERTLALEAASLRARDLDLDTQEVYILQSLGSALEWYAVLLGTSGGAPALELGRRLMEIN